MKRTPIEQERIYARFYLTVDCYSKHTKNSNKKVTHIKKNGPEIWTESSKKGINMAKKYFKNHSLSLPISENQDVFKISFYYNKNVKTKQPTTNAREGEGKWNCHC